MNGAISRVVIVGGGTAGWLAAALLASARPGLAITLVESADIPTIGVGEGTWPTMRATLSSIGIPEAEFLESCDASYKQGSRFDGWVTGDLGDSYLHPFTLPPSADMKALLAAWGQGSAPFASAMTAQAQICAKDLAPRQRAMPDYAGAFNYAYHLDAGKFAALLARHATSRLGVQRITGTVIGVIPAVTGDIAALELRGQGTLHGDLFIDCSGLSALLIDGYCKSPWIDRSDVSFNDRALALQVPVLPDSAIASQTIGTAHAAGWLWDIALPTRRGIGCVYSSRFMTEAAATEVLFNHVKAHVPGADISTLSPKPLAYPVGHRARFWDRNCLAVGLSAGFIEPLEASAIVMIELSMRALVENFPVTRSAMDFHAARFNELFCYRWDRIIEFLKLHYILSKRTEPYWLAQRDPVSIPYRLVELMGIWRHQPPSAWDFPQIEEIFPAASYQYVLYGMGFQTQTGPVTAAQLAEAGARLREVHERGRAMAAALPHNRTCFPTNGAQAA